MVTSALLVAFVKVYKQLPTSQALLELETFRYFLVTQYYRRASKSTVQFIKLLDDGS